MVEHVELMLGRAVAMVTVLGLVACAALPPQPPPGVVPVLAPTGSLKVGMPTYDVIVGGRDRRTDQYQGVAPDLARRLAGALGTPVTFVPYESEAALLSSFGERKWDIAFVELTRTLPAHVAARPFMASEFTFLVPRSDPAIQTVSDVRQRLARIAAPVSTRASEFLSQAFPERQYVPARAGTGGMFELLSGGRADAYAESAQTLTGMAPAVPSYRILDDTYAIATYAIAVADGNPEVLAYIDAFLDWAQASGETEGLIKKAGLVRVNATRRPASADRGAR